MQSLAEIDRKIAELQQQKKVELQYQRNEDLKMVKDLVKQHGFTARMLKGYLGEGRNRRTKAAMM